MVQNSNSDTRIEHLRAVAERLGLQLRRADHCQDGWHIVDPLIDGKLYAFSFTNPHTFCLDEVEEILAKRAAREGIDGHAE